MSSHSAAPYLLEVCESLLNFEELLDCWGRGPGRIERLMAPAEGRSGSRLERWVGRPREPSAAREHDPAVAVRVNSAGCRPSNTQARTIESEEDRELAERAQQGDVAAFRRLVERYQRRVFVVAYSLVRDEQDARDVVQEAFLRVYRGLDTYNGQGSFFTWLYRIVRNLSIDSLRRASRRESEGLDDVAVDQAVHRPLVSHIEGEDPVESVRRGELARQIHTALDALPSYHRDAIVLREVEGMSYDEMAEAMGVSKGTIMSRLYHARRKLQEALADCYYEQLGGPPSPVAGRSRARAAPQEPR